MIKYPNIIYKTILAGDAGTGKSTLLQSKLTGKFSPVEKLTIGIDFDCYPIESKPDPVTLLIYDLGAASQFLFIHKAFIIGAKAAIILYDISRIETLYNVSHWISLLQSEYISIPIVIVGTKADLVSKDEIQKINKKWDKLSLSIPKSANLLDHIMISSKNIEDCNKAFSHITKLAVAWKSQFQKIQSNSIPTKHTY